MCVCFSWSVWLWFKIVMRFEIMSIGVTSNIRCCGKSKKKMMIRITMKIMMIAIMIITTTIMIILIIETFRNVTLTVTVTVRGARRLWRHRIVCIWNAPNRRPNRNCQHMTVSAADNRTRFTVSGHAKFHKIFRENDIDLLYFNKQLSKCITHL